MTKRILTLILFCLIAVAYGQNTKTSIVVTGKVIGDNAIVFNRVMVVNRTTGSGTFVGIEGNFSITLSKNDTLMFAYSGYKTKKISFRDSVFSNEYLIAVKLDPLSYMLKEISIYPVKKLNEVQREIELMDAHKKRVGELQGVSAVISPITALYQRFSKLEQSKRKVAEMENDDMKREVLKDLFRIYIKYDIIELTDSQFDDFITFCDLPDYYIMHATQYELVEAIKGRYLRFAEMNDYVRHKH